MRYLSLPHCLPVLLLILLQGCVFKPDHQYVNPVQPTQPIVTVDISTPGFTDPYLIVTTTTFSFPIGAKYAAQATVAVNGVNVDVQTISSTTNDLFQFTVDPTTLQVGNNAVVISVEIDTNSGSLADHLDLEKLIFPKTFTLVVDNVPPAIPTPTLALENNKLTMRWTALQKKNFQLKLRRLVGGPNFTTLPDTLLDPTSTVRVDGGYLGGEVKYSLILTGVGFTASSPAVDFNFDPMNPSVQVDANGFIHVLFAQPIQAVGTNPQLKIFNGFKVWEPLFPLNTTDAVVDTLLLGGTNIIYAELTSPNYPDRAGYSKQFTVHASPNMKPFDWLQDLPTQNKWVAFTSNQTAYRRYSYGNGVWEDSIRYTSGTSQLYISQDGEHGVASLPSSGYFQFNPLNFSQQTSLSSSVWPVGDPHPTLKSISNSNLVSLWYNSSGDAYPALTDLTHNQVVYQNPSFNNSIGINSTPYLTLSPDGNYLVFYDGTVYFNSSNTWTYLGTIPNLTSNAGSFINFRGPGSTELMVFDGTTVNVFDLSLPDASHSYAAIRSVNIVTAFPAAYYVGYDMSTQRLFVDSFITDPSQRVSLLQTVDIDSFLKHESAKAVVGNDPICNSCTYPMHVYANGYHFLSTGYFQKIQ